MKLDYAKNMKFEEEPNYELIKDLFKRVIKNNEKNSEEDYYKFIWEKKLVNCLEEFKNGNKENLMKAKESLFHGYYIDIEYFIKCLRTIDKINLIPIVEK